MTQPLALVVYEKILPGTQLVNRLQDLNYRVHVQPDATRLAESAKREGPMVVLADLDSDWLDVSSSIRELLADPATAHIPVIAFADAADGPHAAAARAAGAKLVVGDAALMAHLPQFLDQALALE